MSSKKKYLLLIILISLCFICTPNILASVIINEFSPSTDPEWIELYNDGDTDIDLAGYLLEDGNSIKTDDLTLSGIISAQGFIVFNHTDGWLNNGGDTIKLYNNATTPVIIDQYTYGTVNSTKSVARIPNGSENWEITSNITNNATNPTPTLTPTQTLTETPTQEPTKTPSSTPTVTSTPKPTPTKTATPKPINTPTIKPINDSDNKIEPILVGLNNGDKTPEGEVLGEGTSKKSSLVPIIFISLGLLFMSLGGVSLFKKMKTEYNKTYEK